MSMRSTCLLESPAPVCWRAQHLFVESSERELERPYLQILHCFLSHLEMENCKRMNTVNREFLLPEAMIQHIQSFMSGVEAARTTILSKSWYNAWLTRPVLDFKNNYFLHFDRSRGLRASFEEFVEKTLLRYGDLNLNIERFRLLSRNDERWNHTIIAYAMMILGATDVEIDLNSFNSVSLPQGVLGSKTLLTLSVSRCIFKGNYVRCASLKSLKLEDVNIRSDHEFKDIISCCVLLEELSLLRCSSLKVSRMNLYELHKLKRIYLGGIGVDSMFFTDFASRFPCLKELSILNCLGCKRIDIASPTLELITIHLMESWTGSFQVPNIFKFSYSGCVLPRFSISGASREWELDLSIACNRFNKLSWFLRLKKLLSNFRQSRISLSIYLNYGHNSTSVHKDETEVAAEPLVVESLMIYAPSSFCCPLLVRLFGICRPKYLSHYWWHWQELSSVVVYEGMMHTLITPSRGIPDQDVFGQFGLKEVNMEVYEEFGTKCRCVALEQPLDLFDVPENRHKVRFKLVWG